MVLAELDRPHQLDQGYVVVVREDVVVPVDYDLLDLVPLAASVPRRAAGHDRHAVGVPVQSNVSLLTP